MQDSIVFHDPEHTVSVAMAEHTVHVIVVHVDGFTGVGEMPVHVFQKEACGFLFERLIFVMFQYGFQFPAFSSVCLMLVFWQEETAKVAARQQRRRFFIAVDFNVME